MNEEFEEDVLTDNVETYEPAKNVTQDPAQSEPESDVTKTKQRGCKAEIVFSEDEAKLHFKAPFAVMLYPCDDTDTRGELLKSIVEMPEKIQASQNLEDSEKRELEELFRRWCCRTFNMSDVAFQSADGLKEEVSKVASRIDNLVTAQASSQEIPQVKASDFHSGTKDDRAVQGSLDYDSFVKNAGSLL